MTVINKFDKCQRIKTETIAVALKSYFIFSLIFAFCEILDNLPLWALHSYLIKRGPNWGSQATKVGNHWLQLKQYTAYFFM